MKRCFLAVFPDVPEGQISSLKMDSLRTWDSVAAATLFTTIEEEFGVEIEVDAMNDLTSYESLLQYLVTRQP